ncbi:PD-(D/E)XK nuclease family protein [Sulfurospirillum arcachonense]|uniref:PD-(D/E)XK nuclease family protein n=1 Tax=Sulfurospirillum arcachonense TaxID=57666 RepID=UPI000469415E|nr:PD-(D/E)XK nuclease family protein [Sulfurospirillum arcachonense]
MTEIFPTSRCVREFYSHFYDKDRLLPKAMGIAEFESKAIVVPHKSLADEDTRVLVMQEASGFENFGELKIDREFLSFIKNSSYLFRFFEELSLENVQIEDLELADTYAQFEEHLSILKELLQRYKTLLNQKKLYDKITLPEVYELNDEFLQSSEGFIFHLEGFLNKFELDLFLKVAQITSFKISLHVTKYNQKMIELFEALEISLHVNHSYVINLSTNTIEQSQVIKSKDINYDVRGFSSRSLQSSFVYEKIAQFVQNGINPENIAVIVPDESFADTLKAFDSFKNLNFAMGESYIHSKLYKKLDAVDKCIRLKDYEHKFRLNRLKIEQSTIDDFQKLWRKKLQADEIISLLKVFCDPQKADEIYDEELFKFSNLLKNLGSIELQQAIKLFLNRLSKKSKDDVMGGKITVMGLLESRGMSYDGVIVVDFSDEFVPKRSQKDMFLSSSIRSHAKLPNKTDRENLQRYFYYRLLENAKEVAISFTKNDQSMGSRFLDELGLHVKVNSDEISYFKPLFSSSKLASRYDPEIVEGSYDVRSGTLSASKLKTILTCKRQFYYKYILKSQEAKVPNDTINEADIGNILHDALHHVLKDMKVVDEDNLMILLRRYLQSEEKSLIWHYHLDIWLDYLKDFAKLEAKRYLEGYRIYSLEKPYTIEHRGFTLEGKIDRIDIKDERFCVIDYKSGKIPKSTIKTLDKETNFQLEFYYLLTNQIKEVQSVYYYDLKKAQLVCENLFEEKLDKLNEIFQELEKPLVNFEKCDSKASCMYCPFVKLCGREV